MDGSNTKEREFVARVRAAQGLLQHRVRPTMFIPMTVGVRGGNGDLDVTVVYEGHQESGSHSMRGAYLGVLEAPPGKTIVCGSRGNFAAAVACAARREGRRAVIFMPDKSPRATLVDVGRQRPHELRLVAGSIVAVDEAARSFALTGDAHLVSRDDDMTTWIGAGTLAAEILAEVPDVTDLLVPSGGYDLVDGMAEFFGGRLRIASVEAESAKKSAMTVQRWRSPSVSVDDRAAQAAIRWLWEHHDLPADAGAVGPLAALMTNRYRPRPNSRTVVVISGSNVNPGRLERR